MTAAGPASPSASADPPSVVGSSLLGTVVELEVGAVAHGGFCVARLDGQAVFVRHTLPGERVRARVTEQRERYLRADAVEVLVPSPDRVAPPCPYAGPGRCGGCDWQHVALPAQRELKAAVVREQLRRLAGLDLAVGVEEVAGAASGLGWRTRVRFAVRPDGVLGLHRHRSSDVEPLERCLIASSGVEEVGAERHRWPGAGSVDVVASGSTGRRLVLVTPSGRRPPRLGAARTHVSAPIVVRGQPQSRLPGERRRPEPVPSVQERAIGRMWRVTGSGFWQVHIAAAETLVACVLELLDPRPGERALDLYCGVGLFAGALAGRLGPDGSVLAVEGDVAAARDARANLRDIGTVRVRTARVDAGLFDRTEMSQADLVVLDPPRTGAGLEVVRRLAGLRPRAIAYVACDPAALARDVAALADVGYELTGLRAFDLFPMTAHVECVALLVPTRT